MSLVEELQNCSNSKERKLKLKEIRRHIEKENQSYPSNTFQEILLPSHIPSDKITNVFRSKNFLVQVYRPENGATRISVNRTMIKDDGHWEDRITWDELMWIKNSIGYSESCAVEVYPRNQDVVNVANIRHLFILEKSPDFVWR